MGPTILIPAAVDRAEPSIDWSVTSWEPSYREVHHRPSIGQGSRRYLVHPGLQLGAHKTPAVRERALASVMKYEPRLRKETSTIVEELLAGWKELGGR